MHKAKIPSTLQVFLPWLVFLMAVTARLLPGPRTIDDSYITYRYARNLLAGLGFVYNPGERVLGTTTPLYTLLMAGLGGLTGGVNAPFPQLSLLVNSLADATTCLLLWRLGKKLGFRYAGVGASLTWAIAPFSVTFAIGGLETSLFVLMLIGVVLAHLEGRRILSALLAALAVLTRPDALILIGPLALDRLWQWLKSYRSRLMNSHKIGLELLAFVAPVSSWLVFAAYYFGSGIPHSITAKSLAYRLAPEAGLVRLIQHYATPFMETQTLGLAWIGVGLALYMFLYFTGAWQVLKIEPHAWPFTVYPWLYFAVFAAVNPLIFRWYLTPPLPAYFLFILGGAETILIGLTTAISRRTKFNPVKSNSVSSTYVLVGLFVIFIPSSLSMRDWRLHPDHGLDRPAPEMAWYKLELLYDQAARSLISSDKSKDFSHTSLAAGDVGVLGYTTGMWIIDTVGLNSPQATRYYPLDPAYYVINYAIPTELIMETIPDYVVILEVYGRKSLLRDPLFWQKYKLIKKIPTDIYGSDGLLILERRAP